MDKTFYSETEESTSETDFINTLTGGDLTKHQKGYNSTTNNKNRDEASNSSYIVQQKRQNTPNELLGLEKRLGQESIAAILNYQYFAKKNIREKYFQLATYQQEGVEWLFRRYAQKNGGGILADDMGLGKTVQTAFFLSFLFNVRLISNALLIVPPTLVSNWKQELQTWCPGVEVYHHENKKYKQLRNLFSRKNGFRIVISSYGQFSASNPACLISPTSPDEDLEDLKKFCDGYKMGQNSISELKKNHRTMQWDVVVLDEAQNTKTVSSNTARMLRLIQAHRIYALTGTPLENNMSELWSLVDLVTQGSVLGTEEEFSLYFGRPITNGKVKDATPVELSKMQSAQKRLRELIDPIILRRLKTDEMVKRHIDGERFEFVLWLKPTEQQIKIYNAIVTSNVYRGIEDQENDKASGESLLPLISTLQKVCTDPARLCTEKELSAYPEASNFTSLSFEEKLKYTCKYLALKVLLDQFAGCQLSELDQAQRKALVPKHKVLLFSQHTTTLDYIEEYIRSLGVNYLRLDGNTKTDQRGHITHTFNDDPRVFVLLMTIGAGGVGLNLVAASRVIMFDPTWNPNKENQATDRAYRFGNKGNVITYRMIISNTMEELFFRRQIFKTTLYKAALDDFNVNRYFSKGQIQELFSCYENSHKTFDDLNRKGFELSFKNADKMTENEIAQIAEFNSGKYPFVLGTTSIDDIISKEDKLEKPSAFAEMHRYGTPDQPRTKKKLGLSDEDEMYLNDLMGIKSPPVVFPAALEPYRSPHKQEHLLRILAQGTARTIVDEVKKLAQDHPFKLQLIQKASNISNQNIDLALGIVRRVAEEIDDNEEFSEVGYEYMM